MGGINHNKGAALIAKRVGVLILLILLILVVLLILLILLILVAHLPSPPTHTPAHTPTHIHTHLHLPTHSHHPLSLCSYTTRTYLTVSTHHS